MTHRALILKLTPAGARGRHRGQQRDLTPCTYRPGLREVGGERVAVVMVRGSAGDFGGAVAAGS